jgi:DNA-binding transcriptional MerR regulator
MSKAVDAFRTIAEVADDLGVPKHVLRFWEVKFPQIRPMKRGGGRRFYRPEDLELLRGIQALLHAEAYTIKGVQKILREQGVDHVKRFGRDPQSIPAAAKAAAGRRGKAVAEVAAATAAAPSAVAVPAGARTGRGAGRGTHRADAGLKQRLAGVLAELEACRALLGGGPGHAEASAATRGRASR